MNCIPELAESLTQWSWWHGLPQTISSLSLKPRKFPVSIVIYWTSVHMKRKIMDTAKGTCTCNHIWDHFWFHEWMYLSYQQIWWEYLDLLWLWFHLWHDQAKGRHSPVQHTAKGAKLSEICAKVSPQNEVQLPYISLAKTSVNQLAWQNTEIIPCPFREKPSQGSRWLYWGATLSSLGGFPNCMLKQRRKTDLVIFKRLYMQNMHICYKEAVAMILYSSVSKWFGDTLIFLGSSLTTSVSPQPRLSSKITQLVKGNRRNIFPPCSPTWSRQFNIRQTFKRLCCTRKVFRLTTKKEPFKVNASR